MSDILMNLDQWQDAVKEAENIGTGETLEDLAKKLDKKPHQLRGTLRRMEKEGTVKITHGRKYDAAGRINRATFYELVTKPKKNK